jgi:Cu+-exporting ATPase
MATIVKDPVCGMDIDSASAAGKSEYKGQTYSYCSPDSNKSFGKDPEKYIGHAGEHEQHHH